MTDTLASRMLVNVLGIPGILLVLWLGGPWFAAFITIVMLLAIREFYIINAKKNTEPLLWLGWVATLLITWMYFYKIPPGKYLVFTVIGMVCMVLLIELFRDKPNPIQNISITITGILYVSVLLGSLIALRNWDQVYNSHLTLGIFISIWVCDSAAYFAGKQWGRKKLLERVSPNKTIVGYIAGFLGAGIVIVIMYSTGFLGGGFALQDALILSVITGMFGQVGDLVESLIKRDMGVKNSGEFLLGHGGVLDRFDSLLFAGPLAYLYVQLVI